MFQIDVWWLGLLDFAGQFIGLCNFFQSVSILSAVEVFGELELFLTKQLADLSASNSCIRQIQ